MIERRIAKESINALQRWVHRASKFCKYGLYHDDVLYEYPHIEEALKRIPPQVRDERNFRITRAFHCSMKKIYLPREEWISYDEDREKGRYLQAYIKEVLAEQEEKKEWGKK